MFSLLPLILFFIAWPDMQAQSVKPRPALNVTGRYTFRRGANEAELEVLDLKNGKVKIAFDAYWIGNPGTGNVNIGTLCEEAELKGNTAVYRSGQCAITIRFTGGRATVGQQGSDAECGFGHNVYVDGAYRKRSSRRPKFEVCDR